MASDAPPRALVRFVRAMDRFAEWCGLAFCWLIIPLVAGITYEVFARYVFRSPTVWSYDVAYMLYGTHFMLGAAYTLYKGGHIRTDVFYQSWSPRTRGLIDASASPRASSVWHPRRAGATSACASFWRA